MSFDVPGESYSRFMGRYSEPLAVSFVSSLPVHPGRTALDVGCGPGAVTAVLAERLGPAAVAAVDPSEPFVVATAKRLPGVDVRVASAGQLPFADHTFDLVLSSLVVHFLPDPVAGLIEMARVARPGGLVAATTWDFGGNRSPLEIYREGVRLLDLDTIDESLLPAARAGDLARLFEAAGLTDVQPSELTVAVEIGSFDEWWQSLTLGVGPAGAHIASLDEPTREALRAQCAALVPAGPLTIRATAWTCTGLA